MLGNFIVVTRQDILVISLAALRRHNDVILLPAICTVSDNDFVFQQDSALAHRATHVQRSSRTVHWHTAPRMCNS